eukprot:5012024-Amphidinium_carterae.1
MALLTFPLAKRGVNSLKGLSSPKLTRVLPCSVLSVRALILRSSAVRKTLSELRRKKVMLKSRAKAEFSSLLRQVVMSLEASGVP